MQRIEKNQVDAMMFGAKSHENVQEYSSAKALLEQACKLGSAHAMKRLADLYMEGKLATLKELNKYTFAISLYLDALSQENRFSLAKDSEEYQEVVASIRRMRDDYGLVRGTLSCLPIELIYRLIKPGIQFFSKHNILDFRHRANELLNYICTLPEPEQRKSLDNNDLFFKLLSSNMQDYPTQDFSRIAANPYFQEVAKAKAAEADRITSSAFHKWNETYPQVLYAIASQLGNPHAMRMLCKFDSYYLSCLHHTLLETAIKLGDAQAVIDLAFSYFIDAKYYATTADQEKAITLLLDHSVTNDDVKKSIVAQGSLSLIDRFVTKQNTLSIALILRLLNSRILTDKLIGLFINRRQDILNHAQDLDDEIEQLNVVNDMLDKAHPLGVLFSLADNFIYGIIHKEPEILADVRKLKEMIKNRNKPIATTAAASTSTITQTLATNTASQAVLVSYVPVIDTTALVPVYIEKQEDQGNPEFVQAMMDSERAARPVYRAMPVFLFTNEINNLPQVSALPLLPAVAPTTQPAPRPGLYPNILNA